MTPHLDEPTTIHTQADLEALWRRLMGKLGFGRTTLWMLMLDASGEVLPVVVPIDDIPSRPADAVENLTEILSGVLLPGGSAAFLLTRPGADGPITTSERAWTRALQVVARNVGATVWPVHRANDEALRVCTPDDLAA
jgi:hypothetical protein